MGIFIITPITNPVTINPVGFTTTTDFVTFTNFDTTFQGTYILKTSRNTNFLDSFVGTWARISDSTVYYTYGSGNRTSISTTGIGGASSTLSNKYVIYNGIMVAICGANFFTINPINTSTTLNFGPITIDTVNQFLDMNVQGNRILITQRRWKNP